MPLVLPRRGRIERAQFVRRVGANAARLEGPERRQHGELDHWVPLAANGRVGDDRDRVGPRQRDARLPRRRARHRRGDDPRGQPQPAGEIRVRARASLRALHAARSGRGPRAHRLAVRRQPLVLLGAHEPRVRDGDVERHDRDASRLPARADGLGGRSRRRGVGWIPSHRRRQTLPLGRAHRHDRRLAHRRRCPAPVSLRAIVLRRRACGRERAGADARRAHPLQLQRGVVSSLLNARFRMSARSRPAHRALRDRPPSPRSPA